MRKAQWLARSGQHTDHTTIIPQLAHMEHAYSRGPQAGHWAVCREIASASLRPAWIPLA